MQDRGSTPDGTLQQHTSEDVNLAHAILETRPQVLQDAIHPRLRRECPVSR